MPLDHESSTLIYVRPMRRKWASCSTSGNLDFNEEKSLGIEFIGKVEEGSIFDTVLKSYEKIASLAEPI
jgi:hypothetical protein